MFKTYRLRSGFEKHKPWITRFDIGGSAYGGEYHAAEDQRLKQLIERIPSGARVLELGSLEGGHSFQIAQRCQELVAVEIQDVNLRKAKWLNRTVYGHQNIRWIQQDVEHYDFSDLGEFEITVNMGVLYHLQEPWNLLRRLSRITTSTMWLWTHYAPLDAALVECSGYRGVMYKEPKYQHPLRGMSAESFWPTLDELLRMIQDCGFKGVEIMNPELNTVHGHAVLLAATVVTSPLKKNG